jgi:magnesium chelatase family protein
MEEGNVTISRAVSAITYPARFTLVCALNPCPCGYFGHPLRECTCTPFQIQKYMNKISGPLLDRIDIHIEVPALKVQEIIVSSENPTDKMDSEPSEKIRGRVVKARRIQQHRYNNEKNIYANAHLTPKLIKKYCPIDKEGENLLKNAIERLGLSARAYDRILKVARTIADLEEKDNIESQHLAEAIQYRSLDRSFWV